MAFARKLQLCQPPLQGEDVRAVQRRLRALDVVPDCGTPDGVFGPLTAAAVQGFQSAWNRRAPHAAALAETDGQLGAATWDALFGPRGPGDAAAPDAIPPDLAREIPLTRPQVARLKSWLRDTFNAPIQAAIAGSPFDFDHVCAIAAKESALYWIGFVDRLKPADILPLCVFDATGDAPGTEGTRSAFPVNAAALRADPRYGDALTDMLIAESNRMRHALHGWAPADYLYKGYGIFQYDLQNITDDDAFFREKLWHDMDKCLDRLMRELREKLARTHNDLWQAIRAYNGAGDAADKYMRSVRLMYEWAQGA